MLTHCSHTGRLHRCCNISQNGISLQDEVIKVESDIDMLMTAATVENTDALVTVGIPDGTIVCISVAVLVNLDIKVNDFSVDAVDVPNDVADVSVVDTVDEIDVTAETIEVLVDQTVAQFVNNRRAQCRIF